MTSRRALVSGEWLLSSFFVGGLPGPQALAHPDRPRLEPAGCRRIRVRCRGARHEPCPVCRYQRRVSVAGEGRLELVPFSDDGHYGPITCIAAHDASLIVTGGVDRCVRIWQAAVRRSAPLRCTSSFDARVPVSTGLRGRGSTSCCRTWPPPMRQDLPLSKMSGAKAEAVMVAQPTGIRSVGSA